MLVPVVLIPFWSGWTVLRPPVTAHYMEVGFKSLCCCGGSARRGLIVGLSRTGFLLFLQNGEPGWYRTTDPLIKSQMLYP